MERHFKALTGIRLKGLGQFTGWIKPGSYYHGVSAPGRSHTTQGATNSPKSDSSTHAEKGGDPPASPHMPDKEGGEIQGTCSNAPTPMETGGAGDGQSWVEQAEACPEEEWRRDRLAKHCRSSPRRWDTCSINPFPLQDSEGRHEEVQRLYHHTGECALARHDVAAQGMASHHPDLQLGMAKSLNNQVLCMILEYHLMCLSQGPSYISPEAAKNLLPSMEEYMAGGDFQGTQDARVLERAKTLRVAVWLHHLDMAATGDGEASYSLEVTWHSRGALVEFLLALQASSLMFEEVID